MKKIFKTLIATSVAAVLLVGATATSAQAADQTAIDLDTLGSLTVHKYESEIGQIALPRGVGPGNNNGVELSPDELAGKVPLAGVEFTITPVNGTAPLNTIFGWEQVSNLTVDEDGVVTSSDPDVTPVLGADRETLATAADGTLVFSSLPVGVYLVQETSPGPNNVISAASPFLVTIPMVNPADDTWNYNVHAYPKNAITNFSKSVDAPNGYGLGAQVGWPISVQIPSLTPNDPLVSFSIVDTLDSRLEYTSVSDVSIDGIELTADEYAVEVNGQEITITPTDVQFLADRPGQTLTVKINTEVVGVGNGSIDNTADININQFSGRTNTPQTLWGSLAIEKVNENGEALAGAQFSIYETIDDANAGVNPVTASGSTVFTSNAAGEVNVEGLFVGDSTDGESDRIYFVKEVAAPAGYLLLENAIPYVVTPGGIATADVSEVENFPIPAGTLPTTGAEGLPLMLGLGALLLAAGVTVYFVTRRKGAKATN